MMSVRVRSDEPTNPVCSVYVVCVSVCCEDVTKRASVPFIPVSPDNESSHDLSLVVRTDRKGHGRLVTAQNDTPPSEEPRERGKKVFSPPIFSPTRSRQTPPGACQSPAAVRPSRDFGFRNSHPPFPKLSRTCEFRLRAEGLAVTSHIKCSENKDAPSVARESEESRHKV